jgi:hypothetical protein
MVGRVPPPDPLLPDPVPLPEPGLLPVVVVVGETPHPVMSKTWNANAHEQTRQRNRRNILYSFTRRSDAGFPACSVSNRRKAFACMKTSVSDLEYPREQCKGTAMYK